MSGFAPEPESEAVISHRKVRLHHALAAQAAKKAIADAGIAAEQIEAIIVATSTPDYIFPSTANLVQQEIGAERAACFDLSAACTGFLYAMSVADAYIKAGPCTKRYWLSVRK